MLKNSKLNKNMLFGVITILFIVWFIAKQYGAPEIPRLTYLEFMTKIEQGEVDTVYLNKENPNLRLKLEDGSIYLSENPKSEGFKESLLLSNIRVVEETTLKASDYISTGVSILLMLLIVSLLRSVGKGSGPQEISYENGNVPNTGFNDIVVNDEFINEIKQFVDFLKNPAKYHEMGAKMPKGLIFYGPPGTGKTLTARAIAGEAGVSFFSVSGSDFIEKYVGVGAMRVRKLFKDARKKKNCIIFIDELDAVGGHRGQDSNSEARQTINALLAEMDGFNAHEGILVIGATNKFEDLDSALIRAGRFDRHIAVPLPETKKERESLFKLYTKNIKLGDDINFDVLSKETLGFSPATIASLVNDAVLVALSEGMEYVTQKHFEKAMFRRLTNGHERTNHGKMEDEDIKIIAYHEAGHAVAAKLLTMQTVSKVTIMGSTSGVGGATFILPEKMGLHSELELINQIKILYSGRASEEIYHGCKEKVTNGAQNDIQRISLILKSMYNEYGMIDSKVNREIIPYSGEEDFKKLHEYADMQYQSTLDLLKTYWDKVEKVALLLIEKETIYEKELDEIIQS